jgi:hypothetical protein
LADGGEWLMTARGLLIQAVNLLLVRCSIFTSDIDDRLTRYDKFFSVCIALTQEEKDQLVARLFDKDPPTLWPASVPTPFSSENPPRW